MSGIFKFTHIWGHYLFHISRAYYPEVGNLGLVDYTRTLGKLGYKVCVICSKRSEEPVWEKANNTDVIRINIPKGGVKNAIIFACKVIKEIQKVLDKEECNRAIAHIFFSPSTAFLPIFAKFFRIEKEVKWLLDIRSVPIKRGIARWKFLTVFYIATKFYDGLFFIDEMVKNALYLKCLRKPCFVLPLGSDLMMFSPNEKFSQKLRNKINLRDKDFVFIYAGNLHKERKILNLIKAFRMICSNDKSDNLKLLLVGKGSSETELRRKVEQYGLGRKVIFAGYIPYHEMPKVINAAGVGLAYVPITPEFDIQPPRKTVDYLACGLPVIATDTKGNRRFVKNGLNGFLVKDSPESIASGMRKLLDFQQYEKMKKLTRQSVIQYDYKNIVKSILIPAYKKVINGY